MNEEESFELIVDCSRCGQECALTDLTEEEHKELDYRTIYCEDCATPEEHLNF